MQQARSRSVASARAAHDPTRTLVAVLVLILLLLVVPPLWFLLQGSLHTTTVTGGLGNFTLAYYRRLLADRQFFRSLANSLTFSLGATMIALCFGGWSPGWSSAPTRRSRHSPISPRSFRSARRSCSTSSPGCFCLAAVGPLNEFMRIPRAAALQRLFDVRHDPGRRIFVVAAGLSAAVLGVSAGQCRVRGSGAHVAAPVSFGTVTRISMRLALPGFRGRRAAHRSCARSRPSRCRR